MPAQLLVPMACLLESMNQAKNSWKKWKKERKKKGAPALVKKKKAESRMQAEVGLAIP